MAYRIGIDVGDTGTAWEIVEGGTEHPERIDGGTVPSIVALVGGQLVAGAEVEAADPADREHVTGGFVERLGDADAVMLGGTPYGVETLIGRLLASVLHSAHDRMGTAPGGVAIVHDDGLDEYHTGLLTEAARLAGVPLADVVLVSRSDAAAAAGSAGLAAVAGAAIASWARHPDPVIAPAATGIGAAQVGLAAGAAAATAATTAAGATLAGAGLGDAAASTAFAAAPTAAVPAAGTPLAGAPTAGTPVGAGPGGSPLGAGPTGTPVGAGPTGAPIGAGPTGTPVGAGPTGTPLSPPTAGPTGAPLSPAAGPAGTPLTPPVVEGSTVVTAVAKKGWKWPVAIGAGVAVVAVAAVVIVSAGGNDTPAAAPTTTVAVVTPVPGTGSSTDTVAAGDTTVAAGAAVADPACLPGEWTMQNDSFAAVYSGLLGSAGASGQIVLNDVSGSVKVTIAADGTWTLTYDNWTISAAIPEAGGQMQVSIDGVDVSNGTFKDDGTFAFTGISIGSTLTASATVQGVVVPIPPIDRTSQVAEGTGTYTCSGDTMEITVPTAGTYIMDRTG